MTRFFEIQENQALGYSADVNAAHKWGLPGVICPECRTTWAGGAKTYPSVDLTPIASLADFETPRPEPLVEYERLRELVRPLLPPGAIVEPGAGFGPLQGTGHGRFGAFASPSPWWLLVQRGALEKLQAEGLRGLKGCRLNVRFRQRNPPELLELELLPAGRLHEDCLPPGRPPPCKRCGRRGGSLPPSRILDAAHAPAHLDIFRLADFSSVMVCTERFAEACQRLGLDGITFTPLPSR
jgi:uncharacterized double-CXXCG motif protein